jgi:transcription initiation factor TFIIB
MLNSVEVAERPGLLRLGRCPECGSRELVTDRESGEFACRRCGLVIGDAMIDRKPEWRAFTPEERAAKVRVGAPTSLKLFDKGLSTTFRPYTDARGKPLPMRDRLKMMRLRKWQIRTMMLSSAQRNLAHAMNELTRLTDTLHIPKDVAENAARTYRRALERGLVRGRSIEAITAASLYVACRLTRTPRSLNRVVEVSNRSRREIAMCYRLIHKTLDLKTPIDDPATYVSNIASRAGLNQRTQNVALALLHTAKKRKVVDGKAPAGMAAATLYIASIMNDDKISQKELAGAAGVTEVTIRNRYKTLSTDLRLGVNDATRHDAPGVP